MLTHSFTPAFSEDLPVLFVYIGWTLRYAGREIPTGTLGYLKRKPKAVDCTERKAFLAAQGVFRSGIGYGGLPRGASARFHVVFVAKDPEDLHIKAVGLYASAELSQPHGRTDWAVATTRCALLLDDANRPQLPGGWHGQGNRRWAKHPTNGANHPKLLEFFDKLRSDFLKLVRDEEASDEQGCVEGQLTRNFVAHRHREAKLRSAKIREALQRDPDLCCEVPGCGFSFKRVYGAHGEGFAIVHHVRPLSEVPEEGDTQRLSDLSIVCANCHAMIHRGGGSRDLSELHAERGNNC